MTPSDASADGMAVLPHGPVGRVLTSISAAFALFGGFVLLALMVLSSLSVIGRTLPDLISAFGFKMTPKSIPGDIEIVQFGCGIAIFAFLPYCQMMRSNVFVDFFTKSAPLRVRAFLDLLANLLFLALVLVIAIQHGHGMLEKFANNDTTMVLRLPESWPYVVTWGSALLLVICTLYTVFRSLMEIVKNRGIGPQPSGAH